MNFHVISLFPKSFDSYLKESIVKRAIQDKKIKVKFYNPRDFKIGGRNRGRVDDKPYGGGPGMVIEALPVVKAIAKAKGKKQTKIIWFSPRGKAFNTEAAKELSKEKDLILVSGRYEGIDARVKEVFEVEEYSVGPYVLTGGELPAMIFIDCLSRQVDGVLGDINSLEENRVASNEVYTRPDSFKYKGKEFKVPEILLSGHHKKIEEWKKEHEIPS